MTKPNKVQETGQCQSILVNNGKYWWVLVDTCHKQMSLPRENIRKQKEPECAEISFLIASSILKHHH